MSIRVMSHCWDSGPSDRGMLLVLLALADHADDAGRCYPGLESIRKKARFTTVRGVQKVMRKLEAEGYISTERNAGPRGANVYTIHADERRTSESLASAPRTPVHPEHSSPTNVGTGDPRTGGHSTPNGGSPEPSGTINNQYISEGFEKLVQLHPRPSRHEESRKALERALKEGHKLETILMGAEAYASRLKADGNTQYANSLLTWLEQRAWERVCASSEDGAEPATTGKLARFWAGIINDGRRPFAEIPPEVQTEMIALGLCTADKIDAAMAR